METLKSLSRCSADLGSQFVSSKEVTIQFDGEDLKNLLAFKEVRDINLQFDGNKRYLTNEQFDTTQELLDIILKGVCNYNLA